MGTDLAMDLAGDPYGDVKLYDIIHTPETAWEVDGLEKIAARFCGARAVRLNRWLEPACGTGRYLRIAARRGVRVVGFDLSEPMLAYTRTRMPAGAKADLFLADMTDFLSVRSAASIRSGFGFNLINTIRHLPSDELLLRHFEQVAEALSPDGAYVVGISLAHYGVEDASEDVWTGVRGRLRVTQVLQFEPATAARRIETAISHVSAESPSGTRHLDSRYELRSYSLEEWREVVSRSALEIAGVVDEHAGDHEPFDGGHALFVLRPRG